MTKDNEPVAWQFQHEETGRITFVDAWQMENRWEANNPRWSRIGPVYRQQPDLAEAVKECSIREGKLLREKAELEAQLADSVRAELLAYALDSFAEAIKQRDELLAALEKIKLRDVSLADAQVTALEAIASVKGQP